MCSSETPYSHKQQTSALNFLMLSFFLYLEAYFSFRNMVLGVLFCFRISFLLFYFFPFIVVLSRISLFLFYENKTVSQEIKGRFLFCYGLV
jgi:multisubunit Na+/H+ antiporter MnhE subunit